MHLITSDQTTLFYETYGEAKDTPMVLIHGLGADHGMWTPQIETLPSQGFFLVVPDVRGHGKSSPVEEFDFRDCARDICELLDHLKMPKANLAGVSMGGVIVQQFACDFPEKIDHVVIADSFSEVRTPLEMLGAWSNWLTLKIFPSLFRKTLEKACGKPHMERARQYFQVAFQRMDSELVAKARVALNHFDIIECLQTIHRPTLVLVGDQFGAFAINMARKTAKAIPNAKFKVLEGGADPSNLTVPEKFDRAVLGFVVYE